MYLLEISIILGLFVSVGIGVFMALVEASLLSLKPNQISQLRVKNPRFGQPLAELLDRPHRLISIVVIGSTSAYFSGTLCAWILLRDQWPGLPQWIVFILISVVLMVVMEVIPKTIALQQPIFVSRKIARPTRFFLRALRPVRRLLETVTVLLRKVILPVRLKKQTTMSQNEFETMIEEGKREGLIKESESLMIAGIVRLGDKMVKDLMTPLVDVTSLADDISEEHAILSIRKMRHRNVPVYDEGPDNIIAMLSSKKFLADRDKNFTDAFEPPFFVPETMKALTLLKEFITDKRRVAIVVDEFGNNSGLITVGDIHEEIFGEVEPDFDRNEWLIEKISESRYLVDGTARLEEIDEEAGIELEREGIDTIGGLLQVLLENNIKVGDVCFEDGVKITVLKVARNRVLRALIEPDITQEDEE